MNNKTVYLKALNLQNTGNWEGAHQLIQQYSTQMACCIHAYLHRVEGDRLNAGYWYQKASRPYPAQSLSEEWEELKQEVDRLD